MTAAEIKYLRQSIFNANAKMSNNLDVWRIFGVCYNWPVTNLNPFSSSSDWDCATIHKYHAHLINYTRQAEQIFSVDC